MDDTWVIGTLGTQMERQSNEMLDIEKGGTVSYWVDDNESDKGQIIAMLNLEGEKIGKVYPRLARVLLPHILSSKLRMTGMVQGVYQQFLIVILKLEIKESNTGLKQTLQKYNVKFSDSE